MKLVYLYGMRLRGYSPNCQPNEGLVEVSEDIMNEYHNVLAYDHELTKQECRDYELDFIGKRKTK